MVVTALVGLFLVVVGFATALEALVVLVVGATMSATAVRLRSTELAVPPGVTELLFVLLTEVAAAAVVVVVAVVIILVVTVVVALIDTADV